jgi:hypothetical protein
LSRDAGVIAGRDDWDQRLEKLAVDFDVRADAAADPDEPAWKAERWRADATRARELRELLA